MDAAAEEALAKVIAGCSDEEAQAAAATVAKACKTPPAYKAAVDKLVAAAGDKKSPEARAGAMYVYQQMAKSCGAPAEPFLVPAYPAVLENLGDKQEPVRTAAKAAVKAATKLFTQRAATATTVLPSLYAAMASSKWQTKLQALKQIISFSGSAGDQISFAMPEIVPAVTDLLFDTKDKVKEAAIECMDKSTSVIGNKDLDPLLPSVIKAAKTPEEVPECIHVLAGTTFVQTVTRGALAIVGPLLLRGFQERKTATKRQCAVIVSNMSKLVEEPAEAAPFLPKLMPALERAANEVSDPEARGVCEKAFEQLKRIDEAAKAAKPKATDPSSVLEYIKEAAGEPQDEYATTVFDYCSRTGSALTLIKQFDPEVWKAHYGVLLEAVMSDKAKANEVYGPVMAKCEEAAKTVEEEEEEDSAEELCNCKFTLAYGSKILLHNTDMRLMRGYCYGLLGGNDSGKTTLMRSIANEQVEGFPPSSVLKCVFVEADILGELSHLSCVDYILEFDAIKAMNINRDQVEESLGKVGYIKTEGVACMLNQVGTLSGGWRMKLALARAMLLNADILMLDEPTNHLDVLNVAWVQDYLIGLRDVGVTVIMVSHDSKTLDKCCTNILRIQDLKLKQFKGTLSQYVEKYPDAKSLFELKASKQKFRFPQPGYLEGVKSKGKPLMKMVNATFTYPGNEKPTIQHITIQVSLASRVACVGQNGAGKSTCIKILTGELVPQQGEVWQHPNARIAYVAQHAFHHIEMHLEKTPNEYIQWRYQYGDDREALAKDSLIITEEEQKKMDSPILVDISDMDGNVTRVKKVIEELYGGRRTAKKGYEYECRFKGAGPEANEYVPGEKLIANGWEKKMKMVDERIAARDRMASRPLTKANVESHLNDVGLEPEYATHTRMGALSGGQKVKVVLAAAMWNQPHIVILDEPTNYLDRDSLGALAGAIEEFEGGVVMITHNNEFCSQLCPETWILERGPDNIGRLDAKGDAAWMENVMKEKVEFKDAAAEDRVDAHGNVIKGKERKKKLSKRELKKKQKEREARIARGEEVSDTDEDEA